MNYSTFKTVVITFEVALLLVTLSVLTYHSVHYDENVRTYAPLVTLMGGGKIRGIIQRIDSDNLNSSSASSPIFVHLYQGIRYAEVRERFGRPHRVPHTWTGIYPATVPRVACPMIGLTIPEKRYYTTTYSEDCLYLNVWRPAGAAKNGSSFPVMAYIYGGGFTTGSIFKFSHDARYIAARGNVIVVAMNYRLGPFGFLYADEKNQNQHQDQDEDGAPGNQGLLDQIMALEWIRDNIARFGGDARRVTIFGNSAGSTSVGALMLSPLADRLFRRAILQSGSPLSGVASRPDAFHLTQRFAQLLNCTPESESQNNNNTGTIKMMLSCLRSLPAQTLLDASAKLNDPFGLTYGDSVLPTRPVDTLRGNALSTRQPIDLMYGVTRDEMAVMVSYIVPKITDLDYVISVAEARQMIGDLFRDQSYGSQIADIYLPANSTEFKDQIELRIIIQQPLSDFMMACPVILFAEQFAAATSVSGIESKSILSKKSSNNRHYFAWRLMKGAGRHAMGSCGDQAWMSICHADELFYLFGIPDQRTDSERQLSWDMIRAWASFAANGDPGTIGPRDVRWESAFDSRRADFVTRHMSLDPTNYRMVDGFFRKTCDEFWKNIILV